MLFQQHKVLSIFWALLLTFFSIASAAEATQKLPVTSSVITGASFEYTVQSGDNLYKIGAHYGVDAEVIAKKNGLELNSIIMPGQVLLIQNYHIIPQLYKDGILINLPQRMLYFFRQGGLVAAFPVGLGKPNWQTPEGDFKVLSKTENKPWVVPKSIQEEMSREGQLVRKLVAPGPENPLGKYWLGLSIPAIGIHSTIAPASIYQFRSHGCVRVNTEDMQLIFQQVGVEESGSIIYQPVLLAEYQNRIYLEVHPDIYGKSYNELDATRVLAKKLNLEEKIDWGLALEVIANKEGVAKDITFIP